MMFIPGFMKICPLDQSILGAETGTQTCHKFAFSVSVSKTGQMSFVAVACAMEDC